MAVQGLARLKRKLKAIPKVAQQEIAKVMEQAAQEVVDFAKGLVPVDEGDLRNSIGWTWGDAPKGSIVLGSVGKGKGRAAKNMRITIYAGDDKAYWARWVEFGTAPHLNKGKFAGTQHQGTAAQPFFYPSWRAVRRRVKGRVSRAVSMSTKRIAAGGK